ncbi:MAG: hypothetical protein FJ299_06905 [Planctomycetes bacterium]|nr:hypothetical protein [Planctomycetota bacterium]
MMLPKLALFAAVTLLSFAPQETKPAPIDPKDLQQLAWLAGTWRIEQGEVVTEEHWRPLAGTTLLGTSHTYDGTKTRFFEFLRITAMHGTIAYLAQPGGRPTPTVFLMKSMSKDEVVFENAQHDHPQRIRYAKSERGITATISQLDGSRAEVFAYERR